jgi:hypothetical protein
MNKQTLILRSILLICLATLLTSCDGDPEVIEYETREKIVPIPVSESNCTDSPTTKEFRNSHKITKETTWSLEGSTKIGGSIELGWFTPSLDVGATMAGKYGKRTTESWDETEITSYQIDPQKIMMQVVYWRELHKIGVINYEGKSIEYDYPAENSIIHSTRFTMPCNPDPKIYPMCAVIAGNTFPEVDPAVNDMVKSWRVVESSTGYGEIKNIEIGLEDQYVSYSIKSDCVSTPCEWPKEWKCHWDEPFRMAFDLVFKRSVLTFEPQTNGEMVVTAIDYFKDVPGTIPSVRTVYTLR